MNEKNSILSFEDSDRGDQFLDAEREAKKEDLLQYLKHLEETYEVNNFSLEDFKRKKRPSSRIPIPQYTRTDPCHSGSMYSEILVCLVLTEKENRNNIYYQKLIDYYDYQMRRLEKNLEPSSEYSYFYLLRDFVTISAAQNDGKKFLKIYPELIIKYHELRKRTKDAFSMTEHRNPHLNQILKKISDSGSEIYGNNPKLMNCFLDAVNYALDDNPCLILGETGTGKELVAEIIHMFSERRNNEFYPVNCGGFTETLFDSELQGQHWSAATGIDTRLGAFLSACRRENDENNKGYYTGLKNKRTEIFFKMDGKKEENPTKDQLKSVGGTLLLDEVNSIPIGLQSKLLRIIQVRKVKVVGEDRTRPFRAKILCASNTDISGDETKDNFRRDLYYRVSKGIIRLPSLRDMRESIVEIAHLKIKETSDELGYDREIHITKRAEEKLESYDWPGNHRELENVMYRCLKKMIVSDDTSLRYEHLNELRPPEQPMNELDRFFSDKYHRHVEKMYMEYILEKAEGNKAEVMRLGGFKSKTPVHTLLRKYELK